MKHVFLFTILLSFQTSASVCWDQSTEEKTRVIKEIISAYQPRAMETLGQMIDLRLNETTDCRFIQAYGGHDKAGFPHVTFFPGLVREFSPNAVIFTLCHELGHLFGAVTPRDIGIATPYDSRDSIEGEADYFAGSCILEYLKDETLAFEAGREALQKFMGPSTSMDLERARKKKYKHGVDYDYPNPDCRLLTILNGIQGIERPTCWYNPKDKR